MSAPAVHWYEPKAQPYEGEVTLTLCGREGSGTVRGWYGATCEDRSLVTCKRCLRLLARGETAGKEDR